jgi:hypothetical protein
MPFGKCWRRLIFLVDQGGSDGSAGNCATGGGGGGGGGGANNEQPDSIAELGAANAANRSNEMAR